MRVRSISPLGSSRLTGVAHLPEVGRWTERAGKGVLRVVHGVEQNPLPAAITVGALAVAMGAAWFVHLKRRPSAEEMERRRRERLMAYGRLAAGILIDDLDTHPEDVPRTTVFYRYRIAGVEYNCAQDLSMLSIPVERLRLELPVQVRYDARNPGDSIVAAESWNGLRL